MKKYFALILTAIIVLTCFTACKPKIKGGEVVSAADGQNYAAVTKEDGGIARDQAGNLIVLVTDANGKNVKGENGEYETKPVAIDHAIVVGNRIECPRFALTIPNGWSDKLSFADLVISKDGTKDVVTISVSTDKKLNDVVDEYNNLLLQLKKLHPSAQKGSSQIQITDDISAEFLYAYVADTGVRDEDLNVLGSYLGFIVFRNSTAIYTCRITSDRDMADQIDEITKILGTIEYIY